MVRQNGIDEANYMINIQSEMESVQKGDKINLLTNYGDFVGTVHRLDRLDQQFGLIIYGSQIQWHTHIRDRGNP